MEFTENKETPSFTRIGVVFNVIIDFLMTFINAIEEMFGGVRFGIKGYEKETPAAAE